MSQKSAAPHALSLSWPDVRSSDGDPEGWGNHRSEVLPSRMCDVFTDMKAPVSLLRVICYRWVIRARGDIFVLASREKTRLITPSTKEIGLDDSFLGPEEADHCGSIGYGFPRLITPPRLPSVVYDV